LKQVQALQSLQFTEEMKLSIKDGSVKYAREVATGRGVTWIVSDENDRNKTEQNSDVMSLCSLTHT
jgi:hypothetical protein